jgi:Saxitoxin biosynthesis operon protein SxtJ
MIRVNRNPSPETLRQFARIVLPAFVAVFGALLWWRSGNLANAAVAWGVGAVVALAALASREVARQLFVGLQVVTYPIGLVVSTVVLAFLFYAIFTPLAMVMRLAGRDALRLQQRDASTHWVPYEQKDDPADAFRQY